MHINNSYLSGKNAYSMRLDGILANDRPSGHDHIGKIKVSSLGAEPYVARLGFYSALI